MHTGTFVISASVFVLDNCKLSNFPWTQEVLAFDLMFTFSVFYWGRKNTMNSSLAFLSLSCDGKNKSADLLCSSTVFPVDDTSSCSEGIGSRNGIWSFFKEERSAGNKGGNSIPLDLQIDLKGWETPLAFWHWIPL